MSVLPFPSSSHPPPSPREPVPPASCRSWSYMLVPLLVSFVSVAATMLSDRARLDVSRCATWADSHDLLVAACARLLLAAA